MEELPDLALERVLEYSDIASRRACRSVCSRWKLEVENKPGLAIVIDDREKGLLNFIRGVTIKEVNIQYLHCKDTTWLTLPFDDVKTLIFSGYVIPSFIKTNLMKGADQWKNLTKLYFYGSSLISQSFADPENHKFKTPFSIPTLKEFHLVVAFSTIKQAVTQFDYGISNNEFSFLPLVRYPGIYINTMLETRATRNAIFLLRNIKSKRLRNLTFSIGSNTPQLLCTFMELFKFIEEHGKTLQKLICPTLIMNGYYPYNQDPEKRVIRLPSKLKSVYLSRLIPVLHTNRIWTDLVEHQMHLTDVFLNVEEFPFHTFEAFISKIFCNNVRTLKYFTLHCDWLEIGVGDLEVDLEGLASSTCLEVLRFINLNQERKPVFYPVSPSKRCTCGCEEGIFYTVFHDPTLTFQLKNINSLPKSLKVFETTFATKEDFDGARFMNEMVNLEELKISSLRRVGVMESRAQVTEFVRTSLRHRKLHAFDIGFGFSTKTVPDIGGSWKDISRCEYNEHPCAALQQISDPKSTTEPDFTSWTIESIYIAGMGSEDAGNNKGLVIGDDGDKSYMRHYFDVIDKGQCPCVFEIEQPFHIDHSAATKSYIITGSPDEQKCWGGNLRTGIRSITTTTEAYHDIYNKCQVEQGMSRIVLLVNENMREMLESRPSKSGVANINDFRILEPNFAGIIADETSVNASPEEQTHTPAENYDPDSCEEGSTASEISESDLDEEPVQIVPNKSRPGNGNGTTPIRLNYNSSFVLSRDCKPQIVLKKS